jgi:hypothetical protein
LLETPSKPPSPLRSRLATPVTHRSPPSGHAFATPTFLRPTAPSIQSPKSPSVSWEVQSSKAKGLSALISDFRANQQCDFEELEYEEWREDDDDLPIAEESNRPQLVWQKKGAKRTRKRVISILRLPRWLMNSAASPRTRE